MIGVNTYRIDHEPPFLVVKLSGKLDDASAESFFCRVESEVNDGHNNLVFDCEHLEHICSLGFGMMVRIHSRVRQQGGVVRFVCLNSEVEHAFQVVGFFKLFQSHPTVDAAMASMQ